MATHWPKTFPPLTAEQEQIRDDFMKYWHEVLPKRYRLIERFNHRYPVRTAPASFLRTLEIGAGIGEHLEHEKLTPEQECNYWAVELRANMSEDSQYDPPATPGFWSESWSDLTRFEGREGRRTVIVTESSLRLYPLAPGPAVITPAASRPRPLGSSFG